MTPPHDREPYSERPTELRPDEAPRQQSRFTPGTILAERFRIIALLGSGGMGEVYRAEDIKLGQQVALKFLPPELATDPEKLSRLYAEVRLGRQVSHPNVCRLYDLTEWQGTYFISMEYIDGEDLASLLRRIGKLPHAKAVDIARDLSAGLAAAHTLGVIHRDLKPANVMIDGRGTARITDFGLATLVDDLPRLREQSGTPAYMAPEQLRGQQVTPRSDFYALGLILYEVFTGKRRFDGRSIGEILAQHESRSHSIPQDTRDIDPAVQRVILWCLEEKPESRPSSVHALIAALPGGDPLQAAIDAGETPSPEMVAAAGKVGELRPLFGWGLFLASILMMLLVAALARTTTLAGRVSFPRKPDVLVDRAQSLLAQMGYESKPADFAYSFFWNDDYFAHGRRKRAERWDNINQVRPSPVTFWYRDSPREMLALWPERRVHPPDPALNVSGMRLIELDQEGRLIKFAAVPPQIEEALASARTPDWSMFFREAGLDLSSLRPVTPKWSKEVDSDQRFAWEGRYPEQPDVTVHVSAGSYHGRPVEFAVIPPWTQPRQMRPPEKQFLLKVGEVGGVALLWAMILAGVLVARRNLRRGRGDRRGALRFALVMLAVVLVSRLFRVDHVSTVSHEFDLIRQLLGEALFLAAMVWVFYIALEPYLRRRWPQMMISWTRLLAGRTRDPLVGRHVLIGGLAGAAIAVLARLMILAPTWLNMPALSPSRSLFTTLAQLKHLGFFVLDTVRESVVVAFFLAFLLVLFQILFRKRAIAIVLAVVVMAVTAPYLTGENPPIELFFSTVMAALAIFILVRFGLLAIVALVFAAATLNLAPLTLDTSAWHFGRSLTVLALLAGISFYGFWISLASQPLFSLSTLEEE